MPNKSIAPTYNVALVPYFWHKGNVFSNRILKTTTNILLTKINFIPCTLKIQTKAKLIISSNHFN